jgi:hypothetical protein
MRTRLAVMWGAFALPFSFPPFFFPFSPFVHHHEGFIFELAKIQGIMVTNYYPKGRLVVMNFAAIRATSV